VEKRATEKKFSVGTRQGKKRLREEKKLGEKVGSRGSSRKDGRREGFMKEGIIQKIGDRR